MRSVAMIVWFCLAVLFLQALVPYNLSADDDWYIEPTISITFATRLDGDNDITEQANIFGLKAEHNSSFLHFNFEGDYRYDSAYDLNEEYSSEAENKYRMDGTIDQAYLGWRWRQWDFNLGYQKVAWGEADDLRVVDVVNPLDLKNFVLFDLDEYRIAQNMLRVEGSLGADFDLELLWLFQFEANQFPPQGSEFTSPLIPQAKNDEPNGSEFGIRASSMVKDADVSLYIFNGYEDTPIYLLKEAQLEAHYERQLMLGVSLAQPVSAWVIRGDIAFFPDRNLGKDNGTNSEHHVVQGLLGVDYLYQDWTLGAQVSDRYIDDWSSELVDSQSDTFITASAEGTSFAATVTTRVAFTWSLASGGGLLSQFKLTYQPDEQWTWRFAIDLMDGDSRNFFGQFSDSDRVWTSIAYTF